MQSKRRSRLFWALLVLCLASLLIVTPVWADRLSAGPGLPGSKSKVPGFGEAAVGFAPAFAHPADDPDSSFLRSLDRRVFAGLVTFLAVGCLITVGLLGFRSPAWQKGPGDSRVVPGLASAAGLAGHARRASPPLLRSRQPAPPPIQPARYCHGCGASLRRDDLFCRSCGARRRGTEASNVKRQT